MRRIEIKLREHLEKEDLQQKELAKKCGLREATVSQLVNNKYDRIQLSHLLAVMDVLNIEDFNEILTIKDVENTK